MISTCWRRCAAVTATVLALTLFAAATDWAQPAAKLAREIVGICGPGAASISFRNNSSLAPSDEDVARKTIERQLRAGGIRLSAAENAATAIRITLSENPQGYIWVGEVQQGSDTRVAMVTVERPSTAAAAVVATSMTVRKTLLWSQPAPILDLAIMPAGSDQLMLALDSEGVTVFRRIDGAWQQQTTLVINHDHPWPRDLRGRLAAGSDHLFDAYLPGTICSSTTAAQPSMTCRSGDDPWPIAPGQSAFFASARNFFTGAMSPALGKQGAVPPFYSAASLPRPAYTLWFFARTDGTLHAFDGANDIPLRQSNWGAIAAVHSGCGAGTQVLATGIGDATSPDSVHTFDVADRSPLEAAAPVDFVGPVTVFWTMPGNAAALAVVHNLQADRYDAYELTITCGQ